MALRQLDVSNNDVRDDGATSLAAGLAMNCVLHTLALRSNNIGVAGAAALGGMLEVNGSLRSLSLTFNLLGAAGMQALAEAFEWNTALVRLGDEIIPSRSSAPTNLESDLRDVVYPGSQGREAWEAALFNNFTLCELNGVSGVSAQLERNVSRKRRVCLCSFSFFPPKTYFFFFFFLRCAVQTGYSVAARHEALQHRAHSSGLYPSRCVCVCCVCVWYCGVC